MTGDFYGALKDHTILGMLAQEPPDETGFARGLAAAAAAGRADASGLLGADARPDGRPGGRPGRPLSVGPPDRHRDRPGARDRRRRRGDHAGGRGRLRRVLRAALADRGRTCRVLDPEAVIVAGLLRILDASHR